MATKLNYFNIFISNFYISYIEIIFQLKIR